MNADIAMLIRYAAIAYGMYLFKDNPEMIETFAGAAVAAAAVVWGLWDRWIAPRLKAKAE